MLRPALFRNTKPVLFDDSFDHYFDDFMDSFWGNNELTSLAGFNTDVIDQGDHYELQAELPGFDKEDIHIDLKNDMLTISAAHNEETSDKKKKQNYVRKERRYASYSRSFHVDGLEPSDIDASYKNGILEVKFPKKDSVTKEDVKRIEIK